MNGPALVFLLCRKRISAFLFPACYCGKTSYTCAKKKHSRWFGYGRSNRSESVKLHNPWAPHSCTVAPLIENRLKLAGGYCGGKGLTDQKSVGI